MAAEASACPTDEACLKGVRLPKECQGGTHETTSSKDSLTRVQSPRNSKSSATVIQHLPDFGQVLREPQSEECTSSASGQQDLGRIEQCATLQCPGNQNQAEEDKSQHLSGHQNPEVERSKSWQSALDREILVEDAESRHHSCMAKDQPKLGLGEAAVPDGPTRLGSPSPEKLCEPVIGPPESPKGQKIKHKASKQRVLDDGQTPTVAEAEIDFLARESSTIPKFEARLSEGNAEAERDAMQDPSLEDPAGNDSLSRVCSAAVAAATSAFKSPRETDATVPREFPQFQRRQRSNLGKRGRQAFKAPGRVSNGDEPVIARPQSRQNSLKKTQSTWTSEPNADDDYVPPGGTGDPLMPQERSQRSSRLRFKGVSAQDQEDACQPNFQRGSGSGSRCQEGLPALGSMLLTPSRSTRSQPQDFSCLWPNHFPSVKPAKRLRGFNLFSAIGKLEELAARDDERMAKQYSDSTGEVELCSKVQQSIEQDKHHRDSWSEYLTKAVPPVRYERSETAKRFKGAPLGKAVEATSLQKDMSSSLKPTEDGLNLPIDMLTDEFVKPHLSGWQKLINQPDCPQFQSSLWKRKKADVAACWEDFHESQALEERVLNELHEWLRPGDKKTSSKDDALM